MLETTIVIPKTERVEYFLNLLKTLKLKFDNHRDAYNYLERCLKYTEKIHNARDYMVIPNFPDFLFDEKYKIYYRGTLRQAIFINKNGAYGIYQNPEKDYSHIDLEMFKKEAIALINFPSKSGYPLWLY